MATTYQPGVKLITSLSGSEITGCDNGGAVSAGYQASVMRAYVGSKSGTFTANGATAVTVTDANLTANSVVMLGLKTVGGTVGALPAIQTVTPGTGFTVAATAGDTSVYNYVILN